jgi:hypothetical protein
VWAIRCGRGAAGPARARRAGRGTLAHAQVAALHGHLLDLSEPDVLDQADEISALTVAITGRLQRDGDIVLALTDADWFTPFDSVAIATASLALLDRMLARLCDRLAYLLGKHVRLVEPDDHRAARPRAARPLVGCPRLGRDRRRHRGPAMRWLMNDTPPQPSSAPPKSAGRSPGRTRPATRCADHRQAAMPPVASPTVAHAITAQEIAVQPPNHGPGLDNTGRRPLQRFLGVG